MLFSPPEEAPKAVRKPDGKESWVVAYMGRELTVSWLPVLYRITDSQVLEFAGLDAYVFLGFFKMCIKLLAICCAFSVCLISPIRHHFTGRYDDGNDEVSFLLKSSVQDGVDDGSNGGQAPEHAEVYLWMYVIFTSFFTLVAPRRASSSTANLK